MSDVMTSAEHSAYKQATGEDVFGDGPGVGAKSKPADTAPPKTRQAAPVPKENKKDEPLKKEEKVNPHKKAKGVYGD